MAIWYYFPRFDVFKKSGNPGNPGSAVAMEISQLQTVR
jgi:hypothetical protein